MPAEWRDYVWRLFRPFQPSKGRRSLILDPFANTGEMLLRGAGMLGLEPYGIELQDQFIEPGRNNMAQFYEKHGMPGDLALTRMLHKDSFQAEMSNGAFSIVYANPPFDDMLISNPETHSGDDANIFNRRERVEVLALDHFFKYVAPNGYMIWIAYAQHMSRKVIRVFRRKCDSLMVFRFPEKHLDHYTLICVVGAYVKGHHKLQDENETERQKGKQLEDWFIDLGQHPEKIVPFDKVIDVLEKKNAYLFPGKINETVYPPLPALNIFRGAVLFHSREIDPKAHLELNLRHGAHNLKAFAEAMQPTTERPLDRPLHRPNKRQMVVNIASGMLDGIIIERNGMRGLLRGSVRLVKEVIDTTKEYIVQKDGSFTRITDTSIIRPDQHVVLLYEDGSLEDISGADDLRSIIADNADMLVEHFSARYKPYYDMQIHPVWAKVMDQIKPLGQYDLIKAQKYVIVCTVENLATRRHQVTNAQQGFGKSVISVASMVCLRLLDLALKYEASGVTPKHERGEAPKPRQRGAVPKLAQRYGVTGEELLDLVSNICERYDVKRSGLRGIPVNEPVIVAVPPIAPSVWLEQETLPAYDKFVPRQLFDSGDAKDFMRVAMANEDEEAIYLGVISYENAKSNEGREPIAMARYRYAHVYEKDESGHQQKVVRAEKLPADPITGEIIRDSKGNNLPWKYFTPEFRRKTLDMFTGAEFYGYASKLVEDADGKKHYEIDWGVKRHRRIVSRRLDRDDVSHNDEMGYPTIASAAHPLYSEVRKFGYPKIGNGHTITPMKEVVLPARTIEDLSFHDTYGYAIRTPRLRTVQIKERIIQVPDWDNQKSLIPGEVILDPWLAWKGTRFSTYGKKNAELDRLMSKHGLSHYRVGGGRPDLDKLLKKEGFLQYQAGLGEMTPKGPRYPIANYLRRFYKGKVALFIGDEIHLGKSGSQSEAGQSIIDLALTANMTNGLTGTYFGGAASSVFALSYLFDPDIRKQYRWQRGAPMKWIEDMGVRKMVESRDVGNSSSLRGGKKSAPRITEAPGATPLLMRVLAKNTLWASLLDLRDTMPDKEELSLEVNFDRDHAAIVNSVISTCRDYNGKRIVLGDRSFLAAYYQTGISAPDAHFRPDTVIHKISSDKGAARKKYAGVVDHIVCEIPSLGDAMNAKERMVLDYLRSDLKAGRRIIIALNQTSSRDIQPRWMEIILANVAEAKPFILKNVKPSMRSAHIRKMGAEGYNVMITNPGLITTAISINNFSAWYSIEYSASLYTFSQATARINRPSQQSDDILYRHFYWNDKFQKQAIQNIADKTKAAAILMGAESGDLASAMSNDNRVMGYEGLLDAIETGRQKYKTAEEIQAAFSVANYSSGNWADSAWFMPGDELEGKKKMVEAEVTVSDDEPEETVNVLDDDEDLINIGE